VTRQEKFLTLYEDYELLIRATGKQPKDVESGAAELEAKRFYM